MRVLIVNTSERTGGAAVAANRLMKALNNNGVKAKMLVRDKDTETLTVVPLPHSPRLNWHFLWERLVIFCRLHFSRQHLFEIDIANAGSDITKLPEFQEADIIHLHWINQGMLSLKGIQKILQSGKPVVWTMHDIWPATALCHVTLGCQQFTSQCAHCRLLPGGGSSKDFSTTVWQRKQRMLADGSIYFVACSHWLASEAKRSALLEGQKNANKGMDYLIEACRQLQLPDAAVVILGGHAEEVVSQLSLEAYPLGYVNEEQRIVDVYNAADVFVLPSLSENLPNTIMEAMACGVPCVGFKVGGIPEEIDHRRNGYVADYRNSEDLALGIRWILAEADYEELSKNAVHKVLHNYSQQSVALKYLDVYQQAQAFKNYRL